MQTAGGLEAGHRASLGTSEKNQPVPVGPVPRLLQSQVHGGICSQDSRFFIPKYGQRGKDNVHLYSANRLWMPGHSRMFFDGNFCRIFPT